VNLVSEVSIMRLRDVGFNIIIQAILGILVHFLSQYTGIQSSIIALACIQRVIIILLRSEVEVIPLVFSLEYLVGSTIQYA
jgi:hypothetical protein